MLNLANQMLTDFEHNGEVMASRFGRKPKWKNIREISLEEVKPMSKPVPAESRLGWTRGQDVTALPKRRPLGA